MTRTLRKMILLLSALFVWTSHCFAATAIGSITITGAEQSSGSTWDTGTVTVAVNGVSMSIPYGKFSTPASIASALAALISQNCNMPAYAQANGATLTFYQKGSNTITSASITSASSDPSLFTTNSFLPNPGGNSTTPQITNLSLSEGPPGMGFTITGTGFTAGAQVTVGGQPATIIVPPSSSNTTSITVQVPSGTTTAAGVVVTIGGWMGTASFTVTSPFGCN